MSMISRQRKTSTRLVAATQNARVTVPRLGRRCLREGIPIGIILVRRRERRPFSNDQVALIETFADQATIAIENARLFEAEKQRTAALANANRDLSEREATFRRLVASNILGIFIWDFDGGILEANDEFLRLVNYDREDPAAGRIRWEVI